MNVSTLKSVGFSLIVGLTLAMPIYAQTAQMKSMPAKSGMDMSKSGSMTGMMGAMKISGPVKMNGQACNMKCDMMPMGKSKGMMGMGNMKGMDSMKMHKPMKMEGTMTMMGQSYHCTMTMTAPGK